MDYLKEFISKLHNLDKARRVNEVFKDFLILCTCSLAQPFYRSSEIEQRYLNTVKHYTKEQAEEFSKLLALLVMALEEKHQDFLGQVYMQLNLGNVANGQFFTPYNVSKMMSKICFVDIEKQLEEKDFITLSEPCCGSGGMIIAYAETLKEHGYNYQYQLFVEAIDIDEMCFMMAYIQLSLLGVGAKVIHGDSLTLNFHKVLYTPFYFVNGVGWKLKLQNKASNNELPQNVNNKQLTLFNF
ncbi:putative uncharacterized protein [Clostridium sp. CAG:967]|nr:putative uncharacterized protein [Clostridium sp. CAG:967]